MTRSDFKAWFLDGHHYSEEDPCDVLNCFDAEEAAKEMVECSDYYGHVDGDPIDVVVLDPKNGERRTFRVSVMTDVVFTAEETTDA